MATISRLAADLLGVHTTDALLSRRQTWVGAIVKTVNCASGEQYYGTYWRVTESYRNPDGTFYIGGEYLGTQQPSGPVYIYDGTTWDMPAVPSTVFPKWVPLGTAVMLGGGLLFLLAAGSQVLSDEAGYLGKGPEIVLGLAAFIALVVFATCWSWFYRIEPVRGSKVLAGMAVAHEVHMHSNDGTEYSNHSQGPLS